jgi:PIN domain nuclease of toxin-antitoxin system
LEPHRLSREQTRVIRERVRHNHLIGVSAISLLEACLLCGEGKRIRLPVTRVLDKVRDESVFEVHPITVDIASEIAAMGDALRDPMDRTIVATARVHDLRLVTSDERIIDSHLVRVVT